MSDRIRMDEPRPAEASPDPPPAPPPKPPPPPPPVPPQPPPAPPAAAEDEQPETTPAESEAPAPEPISAKEWQERVDKLTREKWDARRQAELAAARLAQLEHPPPEPGVAPDPVAEAKRQLVAEQQIAAFNAACNKTFAAGKAEFPAFEAEVEALNAVGAGTRADFLQAVTTLPDGHKIYHQLAGNLDEAARLLALPPIAMAIELARMSLAHGANGTAETPAQTSRAPPPIRPIGGTTRSVPSLEKMSMAEFIRHRDKEEAERRGR